MKRACIFALLMLCSSYAFCTSDERLVEAIEGSNPEELRDLLIPGYLMSLDAKSKYIKLAQETTNRTHSQLHQFHFSDLGSCIKGVFYGGLGAGFAYLGLSSLLSNSDFRAWKAKLGSFSISFGPGDSGGDALDNKVFIGTLLALGTYFSGKSIGIFNSVLTKHDRLKEHHNALTIEAIMQRLPAFDNGCFVPGYLN